jgi:hypothetical protein
MYTSMYIEQSTLSSTFQIRLSSLIAVTATAFFHPPPIPDLQPLQSDRALSIFMNGNLTYRP